ncbi:hypothetical protein STEG23_019640 [Scotinomys teguina]
MTATPLGRDQDCSLKNRELDVLAVLVPGSLTGNRTRATAVKNQETKDSKGKFSSKSDDIGSDIAESRSLHSGTTPLNQMIV